ncbi:LysR substrate-binding domain-containing protein [Methylovirgula sp. 4M-Z18]|uniref:LysR substrate-binding domain-containing protein n=1 Tax=Methylovirgula sp. 4M-Z18 TaxID=2293567 RepID=UPI000E2F855D|nr:LysR substrate-binding domain-containing protein [Methylovirgula sp. 4M-Z18]RFB80755.1 LysR family transcriptional regulator [Methylovirgula sp. 4M-Z18]
MHDLPPLKALRVFDACIRLGSFTRAAKELNVGQPAISHQIQALEQDIGMALFERRGAQTTPTAEALAFHRTIASALADMARATVEMRRHARRPGLALATYPGIAMYWLMPKLAALRQSEPQFSFRVTTAERDIDMRIEDADFAILFGEGNWPGFESRLLVKQEVVPVAAPALAARVGHLSRASLLEQGPLIHLEDKTHRWFTWQDWRDRRAPDAEMIDAGIHVTNHGIAIHQTLIGVGIALGWHGVIDDLLANGLLVALDSEPLRSERGYYLVAPRRVMESDIGVTLLRALLGPDSRRSDS